MKPVCWCSSDFDYFGCDESGMKQSAQSAESPQTVETRVK